MGSYRERLRVPVSYWLLAVPVVVLLGAEAYFFTDGFIPPLVMGVLAVVVAAFFVNWSSASIEVTGPVLRAGRETLPLSETDEVVALDERQARQLLGPRADPAAHILLRPYLKRAVYIGLASPRDGVPYWLLATRHPEELAAAILRGRASDGPGSDGPGSDGQGSDGQGSDGQGSDDRQSVG